jgi:preprotein translocase subunit SecF
MKIFKKEPDFKFMKKRLFAFALSGLVILAGAYIFFTRGFNLGIEFTGGTLIEVGFKDKIDVATVKSILKEGGFENFLVQKVGEKDESTFLIKAVADKEKMKSKDFSLAQAGEEIRNIFVKKFGNNKNDNVKKDINRVTENELSDFLKSKGIDENIAFENARLIKKIPMIIGFSDIDSFRDENGSSVLPEVSQLIKDNYAVNSPDINQMSKSELGFLLDKFWKNTNDADVETVVSEIGKKAVINNIITTVSKMRIVNDYQKLEDYLINNFIEFYGKRIKGILNGDSKLVNEVVSLLFKDKITPIIKKHTFIGNIKVLKEKAIGAQVGYDLQKKTVLATIWALIGMLVYVAFRFKFVFGVSALVTLAHDVLVSLSAILFFNVEMSLSVVAALLTIIGYSLNDTIVIFDRVRDNIKPLKREGADVVLDRSINQTLSRTIVTSGTTLLTVLSLFFFGGDVIHAFSFTLIVGVIVGTYSSIFQSCAWLKIWEKYFLETRKKKN